MRTIPSDFGYDCNMQLHYEKFSELFFSSSSYFDAFDYVNLYLLEKNGPINVSIICSKTRCVKYHGSCDEHVASTIPAGIQSMQLCLLH